MHNLLENVTFLTPLEAEIFLVFSLWLHIALHSKKVNLKILQGDAHCTVHKLASSTLLAATREEYFLTPQKCMRKNPG